ncbi:phage head closure protein [Paenibacillus sp. HJGM_3]|uniref:phage head closure protein n=1 Tax=Paenibacillus sp. HJGM_3 TaxID=3379816 RepID=UPI0038580EC9
MEAGRLRHRITLEQFTTSPDGAGGVTEAWVAFETVWAAVEPLRGREMVEHQQIQSGVTHRVRRRYRSGINSKMRIKFGGRIFRIDSVINPDERNREMQLMCEEVAVP